MHVLDVDDAGGDTESSIVRHARRYHDGSIAATILLGRSCDTGIKWTMVSRALCDVSLSRSSFGGRREKVCMVDDTGVSSGWEVGKGRGGTHNQSRPPPKSSAPSAFLSMRKAPGKHGVFLDGRLVDVPLGRPLPLKQNSILSLYGPTGFAYQIQISDSNDGRESIREDQSDDVARMNNVSDNDDDVFNKKSKKRKYILPPYYTPTDQTTSNDQNKQRLAASQQTPNLQPKPHQQLRHRAHQLMIGECTCAMCMDILVKSTFAYPCGHAFCAECAESVVNAAVSNSAPIKIIMDANASKGICPTCRGQVEGWMPARSFDTMVWATALQGRFERDDAQYYLERRKKCGECPPSKQEQESILNIRTSENGNIKMEDGGSNENYPPLRLASHRLMEITSSTFISSLPSLFPSSNNYNSNGNISSITQIETVRNPSITSNFSNYAMSRVIHPTTFTNIDPVMNSIEGRSAEDAICLD